MTTLFYVSRFPQEYDIEMVGTYEGQQQLKDARKLIVNLVEVGNKLEFRKWFVAACEF